MSDPKQAGFPGLMASNLNAQRNPRSSITERLAAALQKTEGSISLSKHGEVFKTGIGHWDMAKEWHGNPLQCWLRSDSLWTKGIVIRFYVMSPAIPNQAAAFTLHLTPPMTDAEIAQMAETYMMVLNMRRIE